MLIDKNDVVMKDMSGGATAAMQYGKCPAVVKRFCFSVDVETGQSIECCEYFDQGNPADDQLQCTWGIDSRPLP